MDRLNNNFGFHGATPLSCGWYKSRISVCKQANYFNTSHAHSSQHLMHPALDKNCEKKLNHIQRPKAVVWKCENARILLVFHLYHMSSSLLSAAPHMQAWIVIVALGIIKWWMMVANTAYAGAIVERHRQQIYYLVWSELRLWLTRLDPMQLWLGESFSLNWIEIMPTAVHARIWASGWMWFTAYGEYDQSVFSTLFEFNLAPVWLIAI